MSSVVVAFSDAVDRAFRAHLPHIGAHLVGFPSVSSLESQDGRAAEPVQAHLTTLCVACVALSAEKYANIAGHKYQALGRAAKAVLDTPPDEKGPIIEFFELAGFKSCDMRRLIDGVRDLRARDEGDPL